MEVPPQGVRRLWEVFWAALRLGLTSFGGPIAHLGYFHDEYVVRRKWLDEHTYADMVALCQFLPGPASSQVGIAVGMTRAGMLGGALPPGWASPCRPPLPLSGSRMASPRLAMCPVQAGCTASR